MYNMYILLFLAFYTDKHRITSGMGPFGDWQDIKYCPQGQVIVGFNLIAAKSGILDDEVAATNFIPYCGNPFTSQNPSKLFCPNRHAVRGIQTQVQEPQGNRDDSALNNVDLFCGEVGINISCTHKFATLLDYSNSGGFMDEKEAI